MLLRAIDDLKIDIKNSYLIWDTITDIIAWQKNILQNNSLQLSKYEYNMNKSWLLH